MAEKEGKEVEAPAAAASSSDGTSGEQSNIQIFLRLRPTQAASPYCRVEGSESRVEFNIPRDVGAGYVNNQREHYEYKFNGILPMGAKQDEVFEKIARRPCLSALEGVNATVFAYGQTGSGKTFTITGGAERYVDRGLIPRAISLMYSEMSRRSDYSFAVHISYLEIYNDMGYDLLNPEHETKSLEDLPRVSMLEDEDGNVHLRNLSAHRADNEEQALNLLFLGDTNRAIAETPMNMASSRSHCIFTVNVEARKAGADTVRRSKLHMVDLAGSERVAKTGIDGSILREAKHINLSLHYLEQVIIALQERATGHRRPHIPYRNSMMTSVLRDSLGGNCRTAMVAMMNPESGHLDESISTCRFAQRVAMISNKVEVNEELDPSLVIRRLKQEVRDLKEEIRLLKGDGEDADRGPLTESELDRVRKQVGEFVESGDPEATLSVGASMMHIRASWAVFKEMVRRGGGGAAAAFAAGPPGAGSPFVASADAGKTVGGGGDVASQEQIRKLQLQVRQRDNEINILASMLQKREAGGAGANVAALSAGQAAASRAAAEAPSPSTSASPSLARGAAETAGEPEMLSANLLADRNKAFEHFRKSYRKNEVIEENKALLKQKYGEAKALGAAVNAARNRINELKATIEQRRVQRGVQAVAEGGDGAAAADPEEERCKALIEKEKNAYHNPFNRLRDLKKEIEHLQMLLEQSRKRLTQDFEQWLTLMLRQQQQQQGGAGPASPAPPQRPAALGLPGGGVTHSVAAGPRQAWGAGDAGARAPPVHTVGALPHGSPQQPTRSGAGGPLMTGDAAADADILAFYEAREKLLAGRGAAAAAAR